MRIEVANELALSQKLPVQPTQLSQVVMNLLNNAYDAVLDRDDKWIRLSSRVRGEFFELSVEDSGAGVTPDIATRIFEPFFTTKDFGSGLGLGLSISKGIARSHAGDIVLDAQCKHTRFVLRLPLLPQAARLKEQMT